MRGPLSHLHFVDSQADWVALPCGSSAHGCTPFGERASDDPGARFSFQSRGQVPHTERSEGGGLGRDLERSGVLVSPDLCATSDTTRIAAAPILYPIAALHLSNINDSAACNTNSGDRDGEASDTNRTADSR